MAANQPEQPDPAQMLAEIEMGKIQNQAEKNANEARIREMGLQLDTVKMQMDEKFRKMAEDNKRLGMLLQDTRERDMMKAKIEADEAARMNAAVDGEALTRR